MSAQQFKNTSTGQFAFLTIAGVAAAGIMAVETSKPVVSLLLKPQSNIAYVAPAAGGTVAGYENVNEDNGSLFTYLRGQVADLTQRLAKVETETKQNVVLGDTAEANLAVREEFPPAVNLLKNSSFEEASDNAPRQWNYQYDSGSGNTFTSAEAIRTGTLGLKFKGGGTGKFGISQPGTKMVERRAYALSLWVKPVNTSAHTVKLSFWDEVNNKEAVSKTFSFSGTKEWSRIVFQVDNKNNWNGKKWFPMISVSGLGSGALYVEDAQLEEANSYSLYHIEGGGATQAQVSILGDGSVEIDAHGNIYPVVNGIGDLGAASNKFEELRLSKATINKDGDIDAQGGLTVAGNTTLNGAINLSGTIKNHLTPDQDDTYDIGTTTKKWRNAYVDGIGYIDSVYLLNSEQIDNVTNGDITFTDSVTSNVLTFDLNNGSKTVSIANTNGNLTLDTSANNYNIMLQAGTGHIDISSNLNLPGGAYINFWDTVGTNGIGFRDNNGTMEFKNASGAWAAMVAAATGGGWTDDGTTVRLGTGTDSVVIGNATGEASGSLEVLGDNDILLRAGAGARQNATSGDNDLQLAAEDALLLNGASFTLATSNGDQVYEANGDNDFIVRVGDGAREVAASSNDIQLAAEDALIVDAGDMTITSSEDAVNAIVFAASRGGIQLSTSYASSNGVMYLKSAGTLVLDTSAKNSNVAIAAGTGALTTNTGTIDMTTTGGDVVVTVAATNADTEDFILRVSEDATASSANGRDIFMAAVDDIIMFGDTYTLTTSNAGVGSIALNAQRGGITLSSSNASGAGDVKIVSAGTLKLDTSALNSNILVDSGTGSLLANVGLVTLAAGSGDVTVEVNGNNDFVVRAGDGAAESLADNNDVFIAAEADLLFNGATFTLATSSGDQVFEANGDQDFIVRVGDGAREIAANNNDIQMAAEDSLIVDAGDLTITGSEDAVNAIVLAASRGGIQLSTSYASSNGVMYLKSAGTLVLDTSAKNSNIMLRAGSGRIDLSGNTIVLNSGAGTLDLTSNSTMTLASTTNLRMWGGTDTLIGRPGTVTRVDGRLCVEGSGDGTTCPAGNDGRLFVNTTGELNDDAGDVFDVAEYYPASEAVDAGTVVVADSSAKATVKMSKYPYQKVLGVVSSTPAIMIDQGWFGVGQAGMAARDPMKPLVALVGRVPVKVTNENGAIKIGDRLVASSKAGYAMKAVKQGMTLGMALEDFDPSTGSGQVEGKVMTFVNVSWYYPEVIEALEAEYAASQILGVQADPIAATAEALTEALTAEGEVLGASDTSAVEGELAEVDGTVEDPKVVVEAAPKEFAAIKVTQALSVDGTLTVVGPATFAGTVTVMADALFEKNIIVAGNVKVGGDLDIAGAVTVSLTAGTAVKAGDPVAVNSDGTVSLAVNGRPVAGVATQAGAVGETVKVAVAGQVNGLANLSTGSRYYVDNSGGLTVTAENNQALGVALSATKLLIQVAPANVKAEPIPVVPTTEESKETSTPILTPTETVTPTSTPILTPTETVTPTPTGTITPVPAETVTPTPTI